MGIDTSALLAILLPEPDAFLFMEILSKADERILSADAFLHFGKGHHPAKLNFGDCMVYGLAKTLNQPILCKGDDFRRTDIRCLP